MIKKLLCFSLFAVGIVFYQGENFRNLTSKIETFTVPVNITISNVTFTSAAISWDPIPSNQSIVEFRQVGYSAWVIVPVGALTTFSLTALQPCTAYEVRIRDAANPSDVSKIIVFVTSLNYCMSSSTSSATYISNVTVTSGGMSQINNTSLAANYSNYYNNPALHVHLAPGSNNNVLSVTKSWSGSQSPAAVSAWIDFNGNGTFESTEQILDSASSLTTPITANFSVPAGSISGGSCGTTMRVIVSSGTISSPCGTIPVGEVEDYRGIFGPGLSTDDISKSQEIAVYPNPASDVLHISGISSETKFEIYNAVGQKLADGKTSDRINIHHLVKGVYFIQIKDKKLNFIKK